MEAILKDVDVASKQSTSGHFAKGAKNVVLLNEVTETSFIEGDCLLSSKNHTDLGMKSHCLISIQQVFNPLTAMFEKSKD